MGNSENKDPTNRQVEVFHQKFKMVEIMESTEQMILTIPFQQKTDVIEWQKLLKNVRDCDPQFLLMPKKYMIAEEGICGSSGVIKIVFDCFTYSFQEQIRNHAQKFKHFQEVQVWYLLFAIISAVKQLDRLSMKVGDIRPHNIFVNQNGQVKLSGVYSWPRQVQNYLKTSYDKTVTYLSPQQIHQCRFGEKGKRSHIVGESFSVGLTLLHTCLMKPMEELYNVKKFQFNVERLESEINELKKLSFWNEEKGRNQKYSDQLVNIIVGLLDLNESRRLSTLDLFNRLEPHAEEILNLKQFQIPHFNIVSTPTKQQPKKTGVTSNQQQRISPQYSTIQKKQFHEPESIAFQTNYGLGIPSREGNIQQVSNSYQGLAAQRRTPQKRIKSKEKMHISLSNEKVDPNKTGQSFKQAPRQSLPLGQQRFSSNPQVSFTVPSTEVQNRTYIRNYPSVYQYSTEVKTFDPQFPSIRPSIGSTLSHNVERKYQVPSFNQIPSSHVTYQQKYQAPPLSADYRGPTQQTTYYFNQPQAINLTYRPSIPQEKIVYHAPSGTNNYPFTKNIELANSQYTILDGSQAPQRPSLIASDRHQNTNYQTTVYQTSIVKPVYGGEMTFGSGFGEGNEARITNDQPVDLLKKINEQLNLSKQMYPNGQGF